MGRLEQAAINDSGYSFAADTAATTALRLICLRNENEALKPSPEHGSVFQMSATEILDELTKLTPAELEIVYRRAVELHQGQAVEASPELLAAIDAADESFAKEGGVSVDETRRIVASWNTK